METGFAQFWQRVQRALDSHFPHERPRILVLDDYQAKYLQTQLSGYEVEGLYSYLSRSAQFPIASALDIYQVFRDVLQKLPLSEPNLPFLEGWEYAKNFSEDIREILLSLPPHDKSLEFLRPLLAAWQEVASEKALQELFSLDKEGKDIPWTQVLRLPRACQGPTIKTLYEHIPELAKLFLFSLWKNKRKVLGEELFTRRDYRETLVFWNMFSPERRIHEWIWYQVETNRAEVWAWDVGTLQDCIGSPIWPQVEGASADSVTWAIRLHEAFSPWERREVHLMRHFRTRTELLEAAAEAITKAYGSGFMVGLWVGDATVKSLLEDLLRREGFTGPPLMHPTLSETRIGLFLRQAYQRGVVPSLDTLSRWEVSEDDAEMAAFHLYYLFRQSEKAQVQSLMSFAHFLRLLERLPSPVGWSVPDTNFLSGALAQLAGLAYEKLFILLPPKEPLGPWFRPSFLPAPIRRRYYPPTSRTHTAWRLLTLLLYGARETYIYQLASEENHSPLEEFLIYFPKKHPCLARIWTIHESKEPSTSLSPTPLSVSALPLPLPQNSPLDVMVAISPSDMYEFLECPRRYYLRRIAGVPLAASSVPAFLGSWLHEALSVALIGSSLHPSKPKALRQTLLLKSFSTLKKLWSPRRLYRILRSTYYSKQRDYDIRLPSLSQSPDMRFWQRLWAESGSLFFAHISETCPPPSATSPLRCYPEVWIDATIATHYEPTLKGRMDLLITTDKNTPLLALDYKTGALPKSSGELAQFITHWQKTLDEIIESNTAGNTKVNSIDFQAFSYVMNFSSDFILIVANAFNKKNHIIYKLSDTERSEVQKLWQRAFNLLRSRYEALGRMPLGIAEERKRREVEVLFPMTSEEGTCRYCPYKLLCQRL